MKKNIPIVTFLMRTWILLAFVVITNFLSTWQHAIFWAPTPSFDTDQWGHIVWIGKTYADIVGAGVAFTAPLFFMAVWLGLLVKHLIFRETVEADIHSGKYLADWKDLTSNQRIGYAVALTIGFVLGACWIAAALAK